MLTPTLSLYSGMSDDHVKIVTPVARQLNLSFHVSGHVVMCCAAQEASVPHHEYIEQEGKDI